MPHYLANVSTREYWYARCTISGLANGCGLCFTKSVQAIHIDEAEIRAAVVGHLPRADADRVLAHVKTCRQCEEHFFDAVRAAIVTPTAREQVTSPMSVTLLAQTDVMDMAYRA